MMLDHAESWIAYKMTACNVFLPANEHKGMQFHHPGTSYRHPKRR